MAPDQPIRRGATPHHSAEDGFILLTVIFLVALLVIAMSVAAPEIAKQIQRDREVETMQRGKQYIRAIQLYYRKFGAYPPNIGALVKTNNIRFLRKRYTDPITGKDDWKPIHWGQNKTPTAMGFFGQPLAGTTVAGVGPGGGNTASPTGNGLNGGSSLFDSGNASGTDSSTTSATSAAGTPGATGTAGGTTTGSNTGNGSSPSGTGLSGQTFGGAGIIGFSPASPKESILVYKKKNHYNQWEFTYDPLQDQPVMQGNSAGNSGINGQPASSSSSPFGSTSSSFGTSGFGSSNTGTGSSTGATPTTTPPQQ